MEDLPDEILVMILKKYSYASELFVWRLVCKRFRNLIDDHVNLKELIIYPKLKRYFYCSPRSGLTKYVRKEPVDYRNFIQIERFEPPKESSFQMLCSNLKYLNITIALCLTETVIETLNKLIKLEELIVKSVSNENVFKPKLSLPNLKVLSIKKSNSFDLIIESRIKKLYHGDSLRIELKYPDHLEYLETFTFPKQLMLFKNLRILKFDPSPREKLKFPSFLASLEEIHLRFREKLNSDFIARVVDFLLNQKRTLNRENLKIYFANILMTRPFKDYKLKLKGYPRRPFTDLEAMVMRHYHYLADSLPDHSKIFYFRSLFAFNSKLHHSDLDEKTSLPADFFQKFTNIQFIRANLSDFQFQKIFFAVLEKCKRLYGLEIEKNCLAESIIEKLPELCPQLRRFKVNDFFYQNQVCCYKPVLRLKYLYSLKLDYSLNELEDLQIVPDLFRECKYLASFSIEFVTKYHHSKKICPLFFERQSYKLYSIELGRFENHFYEEKNLDFEKLLDSINSLENVFKQVLANNPPSN